jgi:three-Cys-motif partner protein
MPSKQYGWGNGGIPEIAPHSLAKHRILREYVQRYIQVLTTAPGMDVFRITLVDGFAGGGEYEDRRTGVICPGSPQILIDAVRAAEAVVNASRNKPVKIDARFIFVEKDPAVVAYLREVLRKRGDQPNDDGVVRVLEGAFEGHLDAVISSIKSRGRAHRAIFVLDQYGYTGVPVSILTRIFNELPNAEVFLTLAVGWITAYLPNSRIAAERLGLSPEMIARLCAIEDGALDVDAPERRPDLLAIQRILHHGFTAEVGSRYYTPFFIISRESNRPYWFLHMANNERANDVVKALHWEVENHFQHFGGPGLMMLGYDPSADPDVTRQTTFRFDDEAKSRTRKALMETLAARISSVHPSGVAFDDLFREVCNETPATRELLSTSIRDLCVVGELEKQGGNGERRAPTTLPHEDDRVRVARQGRLLFTP